MSEPDIETVRDRANALAARVDIRAFPKDAVGLERELLAALDRLTTRLEELEEGAAELTFARNRDRVALNEHYEPIVALLRTRLATAEKAVEAAANDCERL